MRKNAAGSKKKNSSQTNSNNQSNPVNELICSQLNNAGSVFTSEPSTMDTLNSMNTHNSICDSNNCLKAETAKLEDKPAGQQPVIMSSILKSALIGERTYPVAQSIRPDESVVLADTTVADEEKAVNVGDSLESSGRMQKKEIDELIRQLIQVDDYGRVSDQYTNYGRFINEKSSQESGLNETNRKLIQYVRKDRSEELADHELPDNGQPTMDKAVEDLNELIQEHEANNELNRASNELNAKEDKEDEMLGIIVDKQRSLNGE